MKDLAAYLSVTQARWLVDEPEAAWKQVDGTVVFADVSGFTPLTERLAGLGKVGAEELTAILNRVFGGLLDVAATYGGNLLKFGGDALLLLFTDPAHAERAATAAVAMQQALRPFRRLKTDAGTVTLRMSVGVSSGPVTLFLAGQSHRELLVAGPVVSTAVDVEAAASADEIVVAPATATALPGDVLGASRDPGVVLRAAPSSEPRPLGWAPGGPAVEVGVPAGLRDHLRSGGGRTRAAPARAGTGPAPRSAGRVGAPRSRHRRPPRAQRRQSPVPSGAAGRRSARRRRGRSA